MSKDEISKISIIVPVQSSNLDESKTDIKEDIKKTIDGIGKIR